MMFVGGFEGKENETAASDAFLCAVSSEINAIVKKILPTTQRLRYTRSAMSSGRFSHVIAIDDAPFPRDHRGNVPIAGVAFSGLRLEGTMRAVVRRDGSDATRSVAAMIKASRFATHTRLILLEGIALAGFNVVDIHTLARELDMAVLVAVKRKPDMAAVERALLERVRGGKKKWALIQKAGEMEPLESLWVQRSGIALEDAAGVIRSLAQYGRMPEPLRVAHLTANVLAIENRQENH
jgi:uncharacterized protein